MNNMKELLKEINKFKKKYKEIDCNKINWIDAKIEELNIYQVRNIKQYKTEFKLYLGGKCLKCGNNGLYEHNGYIYCWTHGLDLI